MRAVDLFHDRRLPMHWRSRDYQGLSHPLTSVHAKGRRRCYIRAAPKIPVRSAW